MSQTARALPSYRNPFTSLQQIRTFEDRYLKEDSKRLYPDPVALSAGAALRNYVSLRENMQKIFRWKLETFLKRKWSWVIEFPATISDGQIEQAIKVALDADSHETQRILAALRVLDELPYVGIPVASAFLMALYPNRFTVIDRQAYKALRVTFPNYLRVKEYLYYLNFCREQADRFHVSLRSYDRALWQCGSESGQRRKQPKPCTKTANREDL